MVLSNCSHDECTVRDAMGTRIEQNLLDGRSGDQIVASFVASYGEQVFSAPTESGFNLMAWILPFIALVVGGAVVFVILKGWAYRGRQTIEGIISSPASDEDEKYSKQMEDELKEFTDGSFR